MATIIKRKNSYSVVYNYKDENGKTKQKWETCHSHKEALKRKSEIENQLMNGNFILPTKLKLSEYLKDFVCLYGEKKWSLKMYDTCIAMIENYINPLIGHVEVQAITPITADKFIVTLQKTPQVVKNNRVPKSKYVTPSTIEKIIKLLKVAFKQAVIWEIISRNPFEHTIIPKVEHKRREIWTIENIQIALDNCTDSKLYLAINLSFACSLRLGEILGLTWNNVDISDEAIANDNAYIYIETELERVSLKTIELLNNRGIKKIFPPVMAKAKTRLVLKEPKTKSSIRKVWLPKTLAYILKEWKKSQDKLKDLLQEEYQDYDLVISLQNGRPCENRLIEEAFQKLKEKAKLPDVVFHSLRHTSTTYKLKLNHGDLKATQGDTGHAEIDMITKVYAHILDEDRRINAQKFEEAFYANPNLREVRSPKNTENMNLKDLITQLQDNPEVLEALATLLNKK